MVAPPAIIFTEFLQMTKIAIYITATEIIKLIIKVYYSALECLTGEH